MAKKLNAEYALRANVSNQTKKIINQTQARLTLLGKPDNVEDAINHICAEYEKSKK